LVPCTFTYPASYYTDNFWDYRPDTRLYGYWYKDPANESQDPPVASSDPSRGVSQETQGRFRLAGELVYGDCSLLIREAQWRDTGRYFFRFEKGTLKYRSNRCDGDLLPWKGTGIVHPPQRGHVSVPGKRSLYQQPPCPTLVVAASQLLSGGSLGGPNPPAHLPVPDVWGAEADVVSLETQEGDSLSLSCEVGSRSKGTLSWAKGNESLSPGQEGAGHLELPNLSRGDAGEYWCWVKNSYGLASRTLRVHVQSKELGGARPQGGSSVEGAGLQGKVEGDSLRFLCSVASSPPAVLGWVRGGRIIEGASLEGENQLRLELPNVTAEDGGLYGCWAQNKQSSAQGTFRLLIEYSPQLGTRLNSSCHHQGPSISCSCSLRSQPLPQLQWQVDGEPLTGNSSRGALQVSSWAQGDETLSTLNWTGSGEGGPRIFCLGSNPHGSYAALHFDFSPSQRGETLGFLSSVPSLGMGMRREPGLLGSLPRRVGEMRLGQPMQSAQQGLPGVSALLLTQGHKTPAACRTKGVQDEAAAAQAPLGPGEPDELHYATINFSKLQRKLGEPPEAPDMEYSEVRLK
uniref:Ig-like domain-containing protein n=1 Tax=Gopherus agassizii TaxID=38772 RepID=A0A452IBQ4_9SAUR